MPLPAQAAETRGGEPSGAIGGALTWLRGLDDPVVAVRLAVHVPSPADPPLDALRLRLQGDRRIAAVLAGQHGDGSWRPSGDASRQVLRTLWRMSLLAELGAGTGSEGRQAAVAFRPRSAAAFGLWWLLDPGPTSWTTSRTNRHR
ncbi:hypothetical protein [Blastococcus sp. VKM Ac-2987]|uniref:hypothetical protein n=1 Tax=Blastococcus sp. VKM Ac-2987 TaxID=3004141 RepID=UPI0022ABB376|nr:hypothetical protein [Blastococcus sp. VKM Ac-2987]MCZ2860793.1 hypothetical protein [Blastococcus sp. VKM Ac-2987]